MKKLLLATLFLVPAMMAGAVEWKHIGEEDWLGGAKISSPDKLRGRVVLVDVWGVNCPPCRALLPRMEELWEKFGLPAGKPFVLIGSHRQERDEESIKKLIKKNDIKYPVYQGAGIVENEPSSGGRIPFMYVLNHRGRVVYRGSDDRAALEAVINALGEIDKPPSLTRNLYLPRHKNIEKDLVLGKSISLIMRTLERETRGRDSELATEAAKLIEAIDKSKKEIMADINGMKDSDPVEAVRLAALFKTTWPKDFDEIYKPQMPMLVAKAKAKKAAAAKK